MSHLALPLHPEQLEDGSAVYDVTSEPVLDGEQWTEDDACRWLISKSEVRRILVAHDIRPHRVRMWLHSPDPAFREKVKVICELYLAESGAGDTVVSPTNYPAAPAP